MKNELVNSICFIFRRLLLSERKCVCVLRVREREVLLRPFDLLFKKFPFIGFRRCVERDEYRDGMGKVCVNCINFMAFTLCRRSAKSDEGERERERERKEKKLSLKYPLVYY